MLIKNLALIFSVSLVSSIQLNSDTERAFTGVNDDTQHTTKAKSENLMKEQSVKSQTNGAVSGLLTTEGFQMKVQPLKNLVADKAQTSPVDKSGLFQYLEVHGDVNIFLSEDASEKFIKKMKTDEKNDKNLPTLETRAKRQSSSFETRKDQERDEVLCQISQADPFAHQNQNAFSNTVYLEGGGGFTSAATASNQGDANNLQMQQGQQYIMTMPDILGVKGQTMAMQVQGQMQNAFGKGDKNFDQATTMVAQLGDAHLNQSQDQQIKNSGRKLL